MTKERNGKLLYHLTAIENLPSIFQYGLQARNVLDTDNFCDIADEKVIASRQKHGLEKYVPFHFFAKNPFDYSVQRNRPDQRLVLITVYRSQAKDNKWKIVPQHPLAKEEYKVLDYDQGLEAINWTLIAQRNYDDRECKQACMAECLSPSKVSRDIFFAIYVKTEKCKQEVESLAQKYNFSCTVTQNKNMFVNT